MGLNLNHFNPCIFCQAEVGVYVMSSFQLLFITAILVLGGALGFEVVPLLSKSEEEEPFYRKTVLVCIFIGFIVICLLEIILHEYLFKSLNLCKESKFKRCRRWVIYKMILFTSAMPIVFSHLFIDLTSFKIVMYLVGVVHQVYYIWVVQHYMAEIKEELKSATLKEQKAAEEGVDIRGTASI